MLRPFILVILALWLSGRLCAADEPESSVFSGPQPGEPIAKFTFVAMTGPRSGAELDPVAMAGDKPLLVIFVHDVNRPSVGMARVLGDYAARRAADGLHCAIIFLTEDPTETEAWIKRASGALPKDVALGISKDGLEGPGEYGLNRKVTMTILVAKAGKVTANYALVQPSIQADAPKVLKSIVDVVGGKVPTLEELGAPGTVRQRPAAARPEPKKDGGK